MPITLIITLVLSTIVYYVELNYEGAGKVILFFSVLLLGLFGINMQRNSANPEVYKNKEIGIGKTVYHGIKNRRAFPIASMKNRNIRESSTVFFILIIPVLYFGWTGMGLFLACAVGLVYNAVGLAIRSTNEAIVRGILLSFFEEGAKIAKKNGTETADEAYKLISQWNGSAKDSDGE